MTKNKKKPEPKPAARFVQIMSCDSPAGTGKAWLLALDADGVVNIYLGTNAGWKPLNMHRFTPEETAADDLAFRMRTPQRPVWPSGSPFVPHTRDGHYDFS